MACILIITSDAELAGACEQALGTHGHTLYRADGATALDVARARHPDLVLVDGTDASAVANVEAIEATNRGVPVVVVFNREGLADVLETTHDLAPE